MTTTTHYTFGAVLSLSLESTRRRIEAARAEVEVLNPSAALAIAGGHDGLAAVVEEARDRLPQVVAAPDAGARTEPGS